MVAAVTGEQYVRDHPSIAAYHEAGHVVAVKALRLRVESASVNRAGDAGETHVRAADAKPWEAALILAAGRLAERRAPGWYAGIDGIGSGDDESKLAEIAADLGSVTRAEIDRAANDLLVGNRRALDRLGAHLREHRTATAEQIGTIWRETR